MMDLMFFERNFSWVGIMILAIFIEDGLMVEEMKAKVEKEEESIMITKDKEE